MRVPVISTENIPLMPTKPSRARRWIKQGKAIGKFDKLGIFYIQLLSEPSNTEKQVSVSDANWKRLGQCSVKKVKLMRRSTGLIIKATKVAKLATGILPVADFALVSLPSQHCSRLRLPLGEVTEFPAYREVL